MRVALHGLQVSVTGTLPADLVGELLGGFPPGDPGQRPDLTISLEPARAALPAGLVPVFYYGAVQAYADGADLVLSDGRSAARVAAGGARIDVSVGEGPLEPHRFQHLLLFMALLRALSCRRLFHLHAAGLVRADGRGVLVSGTAGSGKTTLALALVAHGLGYLGDDVLLLRAGSDRLLSFPRPFHVSEESARPFPRLAGLLGRAYAGGPKRSLDARAAFPGAERAEAAAPALVLLPRVSGAARTTVQPVSKAEALGALLESSAFLVVDDREVVRARMAALAGLVEAAATFRVLLGRDLLEQPEDTVRMIVATG